MKQGILRDHSDLYDVYIVEDADFYRLDIIRHGATYFIDISSILFSVIRRRTTKMYGDPKYYSLYKSLIGKARALYSKSTQTNEWKNGTFITTRDFTDSSVTYKQVSHNGKFHTEYIAQGPNSLLLEVRDKVKFSKVDPINFQEYIAVDLESKCHDSNLGTPFVPLDILRQRFDLSHLDKCDYANPATIEEARKRLHRWVNSNSPYKGIDTETTGLDINLYGEDKMVGIILSYDENESTYYSFRHKAYGNLPMEFLDELMRAVKSQEDRLVAHNGKFDRQVFLSEGYDITFAYDTLELSFVYNPVIQKGIHGLKHIMDTISGKKYLELTDIFVSTKDIHFDILPRELVTYYACPDASNVITIMKTLLPKLPASRHMIFKIESALTAVKADQEYYGMRVEVNAYKKDYENCKFILDKLEHCFRVMTKMDGNIDSSRQLATLIYEKMNCPVLVRTSSGLPSTNSSAIKKLMNTKAKEPHNITEDITDINGDIVISADTLNKSAYPELVILNKYREYKKQDTAFYARFERTVKRGRIFFWINQNGAATGRQSSPMHQLPPSLKKVILSDSDDHQLVDVDYSAIELRMLAFLSGEQQLIDLCKSPDNDIHRAIGTLISGVPMHLITDEMRSLGKRRNFGVAYLISGHGLAVQIYGPGCTEEQVAECEQSLKDFYKRFRRINKFINDNKHKTATLGYTESRWGRVRYFKEIFSPDITKRRYASLLRQGNNMVVQGTAADYLKIAEVKYFNYIRKKGWDKLLPSGLPKVRLMLSIHDEVMISADKSIPYEELLIMIKTCMETPVEGAPPFFVSPIFCDNWEGHNDSSLEMPVQLRDKLIASYQKTGVSIINADNYKETLNAFRDNRLHSYMGPLIEKYKDATTIASHVTHPSLTHELIKRYKSKIDKSLSQKEKILEAVKLYIENHSMEKHVDAESDRYDYMQDEVLVNTNQDGDIEYSNDYDNDEEYYLNDEDTDITDYSDVRVFKLGDVLVLDLDNLSMEHANQVLSLVYSYKREDGFYPVSIYRDQKIYPANFKVEDIPTDQINKYIKEREYVNV